MTSGTAGPDLRAAFHLDEDPSLSRSTVDRRDQLRVDPAHSRALWPDARVVLVDPHGRTPVERGQDGAVTLLMAPASTLGDETPDDAVLLGEEDGTAYWAVRVPDPAEAHANDAGSGFMTAEQWARAGGGPDHENWTDLRTSGADLDARGAGLLTTAVALLNWHDRSRFCARDGSETYAVKAGWARLCTAHQHEEYPRTDPSMICLVHDGTAGDEAACCSRASRSGRRGATRCSPGSSRPASRSRRASPASAPRRSAWTSTRSRTSGPSPGRSRAR